MQWDDLRLALAIARDGTVTRAARRLGVAHTTVARRLTALEAAAGTALFDRGTTPMQPTVAGRAMLALAGEFADRVALLERSIRDADQVHAGMVTVTTSELVATFLAARLGPFRAQHPEIQLRLHVSTSELDLAAREADVAIRVDPAASDGLVGRRAGTTEFAVYGHKSLARRENPPWIAFDVQHAGRGPQTRSQAELVPHERVALWTNSRASFVAALHAGLGVGVLPCVFADADARLVRRGAPLPGSRASVWVVTTPALQKIPRIRATTRFLVTTLRAVQSSE